MPTESLAVIECVDLEANRSFFVDQAGFRMRLIRPADDPRLAVVERDGFAVELRRSPTDRAVTIVVDGGDLERTLVAPNGSTIEFRCHGDEMVVPDSVPSLTFVEGAAGGFGAGRAGMGYRDLLPDRWGGRFIASHITIRDGGEVADWVHFHRIRFQMIFVAAGWVDVVYEDQGAPFRMEAGDCVLQPPEIRHRVLRSSPGLEVIEIGCPAEHDTIAEHGFDLPTDGHRPDRDFGGQRFVRHMAARTPTSPWIVDGLSVRDTGIGTATRGLAGAVVVSRTPAAPLVVTPVTHDDEFVQIVGLTGRAAIEVDGSTGVVLDPRSAITLPPGSVWSWAESDDAHEALVVTLPADAIRVA